MRVMRMLLEKEVSEEEEGCSGEHNFNKKQLQNSSSRLLQYLSRSSLSCMLNSMEGMSLSMC